MDCSVQRSFRVLNHLIHNFGAFISIFFIFFLEIFNRSYFHVTISRILTLNWNHFLHFEISILKIGLLAPIWFKAHLLICLNFLLNFLIQMLFFLKRKCVISEINLSRNIMIILVHTSWLYLIVFIVFIFLHLDCISVLLGKLLNGNKSILIWSYFYRNRTIWGLVLLRFRLAFVVVGRVLFRYFGIILVTFCLAVTRWIFMREIRLTFEILNSLNPIFFFFFFI